MSMLYQGGAFKPPAYRAAASSRPIGAPFPSAVYRKPVLVPSTQVGLGWISAVAQGVGWIASTLGGRLTEKRPVTERGKTLEAFLAHSRGVPRREARGLARAFEKRFDVPPCPGDPPSLEACWVQLMQETVELLNSVKPVDQGEWNRFVDVLSAGGQGGPFTKATDGTGGTTQHGTVRWIPPHLVLPSYVPTTPAPTPTVPPGMRIVYRAIKMPIGPNVPIPVPIPIGDPLPEGAFETIGEAITGRRASSGQTQGNGGTTAQAAAGLGGGAGAALLAAGALLALRYGKGKRGSRRRR